MCEKEADSLLDAQLRNAGWVKMLVARYPYSMSIDAAWRVVEKFRTTHGNVWLWNDMLLPGAINVWGCYVGESVTSPFDVSYRKNMYATTAPLAICRAALLAVQENRE